MNKVLFTSILIISLTITVSQSYQSADALSAGGTKMVYDMQLGESKVLRWFVVNDDDTPINLKFYATGRGSELLVFEKNPTLEANERKNFEIIVLVPEDHPDNVKYIPKLFVTTQPDPNATGMVINMQVMTMPIINIGDNPILVVDEEGVQIIELIEPIIDEKPKDIEEETIEEKLQRIEQANIENIKTHPATEQAKNEIIIEPSYTFEPEPMAESMPEAEAEIRIDSDMGYFGIAIIGIIVLVILLVIIVKKAKSHKLL